MECFGPCFPEFTGWTDHPSDQHPSGAKTSHKRLLSCPLCKAGVSDRCWCWWLHLAFICEAKALGGWSLRAGPFCLGWLCFVSSTCSFSVTPFAFTPSSIWESHLSGFPCRLDPFQAGLLYEWTVFQSRTSSGLLSWGTCWGSAN